MCKVELQQNQTKLLDRSCSIANKLLEDYHNYICNRPQNISDKEFAKKSKELFNLHSDYMLIYRAIESEARELGV